MRDLEPEGTLAAFTDSHLGRSTIRHELAADVAALNASTAGESRIVSLVASRIEAGDEGPPPFVQIAPGLPLGRSYAHETAAQYGICISCGLI